MALTLKLRPGERFVINGAVVTNGDRPVAVTVGNFAHILRERDILHEEQATTPVTRAYYGIQALLLANSTGEAERGAAVAAIEELIGVFRNEDVLTCLQRARGHVGAVDYYKALVALKKVIQYERLLFAKQRAEACAA